MKHSFPVILIASLMILGWCSPASLIDSGPDVVTYNDTIVDHLVAMDAIYEDYSTYAEETSLQYVEKIEERLEQAITAIKERQAIMNAMGGYKGDTALIDAANTYTVWLIAILNDTDKDRWLVNLWKDLKAQDTPATDEQKTQAETYNANIAAQRETINKAFSEAQHAFATKHNYTFKQTPGTGDTQK